MTGRIFFFVGCALLFLLFWFPVLGGLSAFKKKKTAETEIHVQEDAVRTENADTTAEKAEPAASENSTDENQQNSQ